MAIHQRRKSFIEKQAESLLIENKLFVAGFDIEKLLKSLNIDLIIEPMEMSVSGYSASRGDRKFIALNAQNSPARQRFTIAHELGHLLLHDFMEVTVTQSQSAFFRNNISSTGMDNYEVEANHFAASLLMPSKLVVAELNSSNPNILFGEDAVSSFASKFQVSEQAAAIRLGSLGLISF